MPSILVAEDSFALANLLEFVLKNAGFEVDLHRSGDSACAAAQSREYDIILLDQQMPGITGVETTELLRASGPNMRTPVFLCTAKIHELDLDFIRNHLHVQEVFNKPFSPKDLVEVLQSTAAATLQRN